MTMLDRLLLITAIAAVGCASTQEKEMRLQLRNWSGPVPRIGLQVKSVMTVRPEENPDRSQRWTQACRDSLGRYAYIVDPTAPIQVTLEVRTAGDGKLVRRRIASATRGVLSDEDVHGSDMESLCPDAAEAGVNAFAGEFTQPSPYAAQPVAQPPLYTATAPSTQESGSLPPEGRIDAAGGKEHLRAGDAYSAAGDYAHAVEQYLAAYQKLPVPLTLFKIGQCYRQLGRRAEAIRYFEQFVEIEPNRPESTDARGLIRSLKH